MFIDELVKCTHCATIINCCRYATSNSRNDVKCTDSII